MDKYRVLIIDDDRLMRNSLVDLIEAAGWIAKELSRAAGVERCITQFQPDVILSDVRMPEVSGLELLERLNGEHQIVLISAHGDISMAVDAMNKGAYSFVEKPFDPKRLLSILRHAADQNRMTKENHRLRERLSQLAGLDSILLGNSLHMQSLRKLITVLAQTDSPILIRGETGTGKDLVARALHDVSPRSSGPYVAVNAALCQADQLPMIATNADGGTLFLDEICASSSDVQASLLRLIETGEVLNADTGAVEKLDLRIVSATNDSPELAVKDGKMRQDLLFRMEAFVVDTVPLRDRLDDVVMLTNHFLDRFANAYGEEIPNLNDDDIRSLLAHDWPGNVRELRNLAERRIVFANQGCASIAELLPGGVFAASISHGLRASVAAFERQLISKALKSHAGRMDDVADALGIARRTLNEKIVKLGLDKEAVL